MLPVCIESLAKLPNIEPWNWLPPSRAMKLMRTPPVARSADTEAVSNTISCTPVAFGMAPPPQPPPIIELSDTPFIMKRWSSVRPPCATSARVSGPSAPPTSC